MTNPTLGPHPSMRKESDAQAVRQLPQLNGITLALLVALLLRCKFEHGL